jgi:hypothetical protein
VHFDGSQYNYSDGTYVVIGQVWKARFSKSIAASYFTYLSTHAATTKYGIPPADYPQLIKARSMMYWYRDTSSSPAQCFNDTTSITTSGFYLTSVEDEVNPAARIEIFWNRLHPDGSKAEEWIKVKPAIFLHTYMFTRWYKNGRIEMQLLYDPDFELHGPCRYYNEKGDALHTDYYEHGKLTKTIVWHE